jgi:RimJ/RimL family protein N-acetyltransferase
MTEAIAAVNDFAFDTLGIDSFHVCNVATNAASRRVKQKTGAEFVGYIELLHHNGQSKSEKWKVTRVGCASVPRSLHENRRRIR